MSNGELTTMVSARKACLAKEIEADSVTAASRVLQLLGSATYLQAFRSVYQYHSMSALVAACSR